MFYFSSVFFFQFLFCWVSVFPKWLVTLCGSRLFRREAPRAVWKLCRGVADWWGQSCFIGGIWVSVSKCLSFELVSFCRQKSSHLLLKRCKCGCKSQAEGGSYWSHCSLNPSFQNRISSRSPLGRKNKINTSAYSTELNQTHWHSSYVPLRWTFQQVSPFQQHITVH